MPLKDFGTWRRRTPISRLFRGAGGPSRSPPDGPFARIPRRSPRTRQCSAPRPRAARGFRSAIDSTRRGDGRYPLTVVGVLSPTASADDRAIFFSLPSFWEMNEVSRGMDVKPLTAVLVRPKRISDLPALHRRLNVSTETQAVFPSAVLLSVFNVLALVEEGLAVILAIVAIVGCSTCSSRCTAPRSSAGEDRDDACARRSPRDHPVHRPASRRRSPSSGASRALSGDTERRTSERACSRRGAGLRRTRLPSALCSP